VGSSLRHLKPVAVRGPLVLAVLYIIPLVLWARSEPLDQRFSGQFATLTSIAVLCAFAGTSAFALNLVLGARLRPVETLFAGLDRMYRVHRINGQLAFVLLLGHFALILASRATLSATTALDLLGPGAGWTVFAGFLAFIALTISIVLTLFVRLGHEVFVYVQRSFGFIFLIACYHVFTTDGAKAASAALNWYMVALATVGVAAFAYRSVFGNVLVRRHPYRVAAANRLDEFVTEVVMEPLASPLAFTPGQFVFVNFRSLAMSEALRPFELSMEHQVFSFRAGEVGNQFHPFSITSAPGDRSLMITVKAVGDYTRALRSLEVGADAVVEGPYGSFSHQNVPRARQLWIAGGIGVTPFLSMARGLGDHDSLDVDFYYCVERAEEAHFLDELQAIAERSRGFRIVVIPRDRDGFLSVERLAAEHDDLEQADVMICGPPAMIESLRAQLAAAGVPQAQIHAEEFGFAKLGGGTETTPAARITRASGETAIIPRGRSGAHVLMALLFAVVVFAAGIIVGRHTAPNEQPATAEAATTAPGSAAAGKSVFASAGCGACHTLQAAGASGNVGPNLDEVKPDAAHVAEVVTNGKGAMPPYEGRLTDKQISDLAAYVVQATA
jgi:predicted ferric reductase/mono/diheme cytochrome c family protein